MNPIFKKLQFKDQSRIAVLHAPASFEEALAEMEGLTQIDRELAGDVQYGFILAFAERSDVLTKVYEVIKGKMTENDPVLWIAYPKKSSKKFKSDISRDSGHWAPLGAWGFEGVRAVAIDADWSSLRFRHIDFIKKITRDPSWRMSEKGKNRSQ